MVVDIHHEWFENDQTVTLVIKAKNVKPESLTTDFTEDSVSVAIKRSEQSDYALDLDLAGKIDSAKSSVSVNAFKVEIKLVKTTPGLWKALEKTEMQQLMERISQKPENGTEAPPRYPTSSKTHRDWDSMARDYDKEEESAQPDGEKGFHKFMQQLHKGATDEQRRAMEKSYTESGGTCLSTNWDEVGKGRVKVEAPTGMEARKYEH